MSLVLFLTEQVSPIILRTACLVTLPCILVYTFHFYTNGDHKYSIFSHPSDTN